MKKMSRKFALPILVLVLLALLVVAVPVNPSSIGRGDIAFDLRPFASANVNMTSTGTTSILTVTESGLLQGIGFYVTDTLVGGGPTVDLEITVDGGTLRTFPVYITSLLWLNDSFRIMTGENGNNGDVVDDRVWVPLNIRYLTSLTVSLNVTVAIGTSGQIRTSVLRAVAL